MLPASTDRWMNVNRRRLACMRLTNLLLTFELGVETLETERSLRGMQALG